MFDSSYFLVIIKAVHCGAEFKVVFKNIPSKIHHGQNSVFSQEKFLKFNAVR